jgi:serine/threonine protein kinase
MVSRSRFGLLPCLRTLHIQKLIGRGGMGVVWLATERATGREVALKVMRHDLPDPAAARARFETEIEAARRCAHHHVINLLDDGETGGLRWFTMEHAVRDSLRSCLRGLRMPLDLAVRFLEHLARTVDFIHQSSVVHRDLSLDNVLVTKERVFKVSDFGLARFTDRLEGQGTMIYQPAGRLTYMAPEVGRGDLRRAGPAVDIFALGVVMSEVLTGRPPFTVRRTQLDQVRNPSRVAPSRWRVDLPHGLDLICLKCLNQGPQDRYESAEGLADDLRRFREGRPLQAQPWLTRLVERARGLFRH